jgi:hypothetical protein
MVNPVAMAFDEQGRIWITESIEYPRMSAGEGRDRIKVLEDTNGDGKADRITVFADGLNIPSGIAPGYGGVWVANAPDLLLLQDTNGDGRADKREVIVTGFGRTDVHELPNSLTWGPDGYLYGLNGVFNRSHVKHQGQEFRFDCAMFRIDPRTHRFELFAEGTSNPWGIAFDPIGNAFVSACVIDHLWHITETGYYHRQAGAYPPFTWKIESIVDHKHQKAAYCGLTYFDSDAYPPGIATGCTWAISTATASTSIDSSGAVRPTTPREKRISLPPTTSGSCRFLKPPDPTAACMSWTGTIAITAIRMPAATPRRQPHQRPLVPHPLSGIAASRACSLGTCQPAPAPASDSVHQRLLEDPEATSFERGECERPEIKREVDTELLEQLVKLVADPSPDVQLQVAIAARKDSRHRSDPGLHQAAESLWRRPADSANRLAKSPSAAGTAGTRVPGGSSQVRRSRGPGTAKRHSTGHRTNSGRRSLRNVGRNSVDPQ